MYLISRRSRKNVSFSLDSWVIKNIYERVGNVLTVYYYTYNQTILTNTIYFGRDPLKFAAIGHQT